MSYDAIIIGGGACGLMCAAQAGLLGKRTLLLERNDKVGAKILISGGGRCNFTNLGTSVANFVSENPKFLHSALSLWTVADTMHFFSAYGNIVGEEKTLGQLFPKSNKAKDIVSVFTRLLYDTGQDIWLNTDVKSIDKEGDHYGVKADREGKEQRLSCPKVVIATGGLPVAKLGASDFPISFARHFGLSIDTTVPAIVPRTGTGKPAAWYTTLVPSSVFVRVYNTKITFVVNILLTQWWLLGRAIMQASSYWSAADTITPC